MNEIGILIIAFFFLWLKMSTLKLLITATDIDIETAGRVNLVYQVVRTA